LKQWALIDGDIVGYRVGFTTEDQEQWVAEVRTDELIQRIVHETNALGYKSFLSGEDNFRYGIYPEYKANRKGKPRPKWLDAIREHIVRYHNGKVVNGHEADDELGIEQTAYGDESVICSIDKDLKQISGWHYNFVKQESFFVSPYDGLRYFYGQIISGDGADNIPGYDGKMRNQVPQFIQKLIAPLNEMTEEEEMYAYVKQYFDDESVMIRNARCLYILKQEGMFWHPPNGQ
jgi:DNA polymerase-1